MCTTWQWRNYNSGGCVRPSNGEITNMRDAYGLWKIIAACEEDIWLVGDRKHPTNQNNYSQPIQQLPKLLQQLWSVNNRSLRLVGHPTMEVF